MISRGSRSITLRLTVLFALMSSAVLLVLGVLIGGSVDRHFESQDMEILAGKLELTRHELEKARTDESLVAVLQQLDDALVGHQGLAVVVATETGQVLFATKGADFPQALLNDSNQINGTRPVVWHASAGNPYRGIAARVKTGIEGAKPATVVVAIDIAYHEHFMASFRLTLWSFVVLAALLTGFLGWVAVRRGLAPLKEIREKAESITATRLDARLSVESVPVELADLTRTLNSMLSRLENSFRRLSDFSSDLAHEFRTPISNLLTQTQVTLARQRDVDEYREVLASNIEEYERLSRMISDMLFLAKADEGQIVPSKEAIDLGQLVRELVEFYYLLADEKSIDLSVSGEAEIQGDPLMIRRAVSNLLSNALRHTPAGGRISVQINSSCESIDLSVENTGETIPAQHLPRLFDRFYRVDASRQRLTEGAGLGLAITQSIMQAHGGTVLVRSESGVTVFELVFFTPAKYARQKPRPSQDY